MKTSGAYFNTWSRNSQKWKFEFFLNPEDTNWYFKKVTL